MQSAELLDEHEERNQLVNLTANDGIWDFDGQSKRIKLSRRWKDMLGYDVDQRRRTCRTGIGLFIRTTWRVYKRKCANTLKGSRSFLKAFIE